MRNKLSLFSNWFFVVVFALLFGLSFLTQEIYSATNRYSSLLAFGALALLFLGNVDIAMLVKKRDIEFIVMAVTDVAALAFLFLIHSNKGAILTVVNLLLVLYLSDKVQFTEKQQSCMLLCGGVLLIPWFGFVKWDYNYNMVGLIFVILTIMGIMLLEQWKGTSDYRYLPWTQCLLYVTGTLFAILYHSRCAIVGLLLFGVLFLLLQKISCCRIVYQIVVWAATAGSILFTLVYVALGNLDMDLVILYKNILSGREDIWGELWAALLQQPLTGIGSAYEMKSFFIFEVHNGLFDILVVHGIFVFVVVMWFLVRRLLAGNTQRESKMTRIAHAGVFAILFTSFFENFFIVPPYLLVFFLLLTRIVPPIPVTCTNEGNLI